MAPNTNLNEKEVERETNPQDPHIRQVEDKSRPAQEVLTDQQESKAHENTPLVFVP